MLCTHLCMSFLHFLSLIPAGSPAPSNMVRHILLVETPILRSLIVVIHLLTIHPEVVGSLVGKSPHNLTFWKRPTCGSPVHPSYPLYDWWWLHWLL